jgi:trehalose/maltose transport system permease protein
MASTRTLTPPLWLKAITAGFLLVWTVVALFPLLWITVMSFRVPVDALSSNPWTVLIGPVTRRLDGGVSVLAVVIWLGFLWAAWDVARRFGPMALERFGNRGLGYAVVGPAYGLSLVLIAWVILPAAIGVFEAILRALPVVSALAEPWLGLTTDHYRAVWVQQEFYRNFLNSMLVTFGVVTVSLTVGTLAGYGLARSPSSLAFWLLVIALVFRALPHSVLVTGYVPAFLGSRELLAPLWEAPLLGPLLRVFGPEPPSLYGQPLAIIIVLVSINQPFTIWMMRSFFQNIPSELDEAARVDGCSHFGAFVRVIMPVMWPGVITTGLFSFLLAYNDYLVTALLLDAQSQTMVPAISSFLNRDTRAADQIEAIAAAVSITAPLFLLVMVFQKQIVSGLTQGAVKG